MKFHADIVAGFLLWALAIWACTMLLSGCTQRLHPLLAEHHGGQELADAEVDIRIERNGFWTTQAGCVADVPLAAIWKFPALGCAKLSCAENKMWETDKMCTCRVRIWAESVLGHELKHCQGWEDML